MANWNTIPGNTQANPGQTVRRKLDDTGWEGVLVPYDKSQLGLGNVDNTSDSDKPISNATQSALNDKVDQSSLADVAFTGDYEDLIDKPTIPTVPVDSVNSKTGVVVLDYSDVGADEAGSSNQALEDAKDYTDGQLAELSDVAYSGNYNDLSNKPSIPAAQVQSDWNQSNTSSVDFIKNKPAIPKSIYLNGAVSGGSVTFDISSAGFSSITQAGCQFRVNDDNEQYSFRVTNISTTSVTVSVKKRQFTGVVVLTITVIGSTSMAAADNGTTVYASFVGA